MPGVYAFLLPVNGAAPDVAGRRGLALREVLQASAGTSTLRAHAHCPGHATSIRARTRARRSRGLWTTKKQELIQ